MGKHHHHKRHHHDHHDHDDHHGCDRNRWGCGWPSYFPAQGPGTVAYNGVVIGYRDFGCRSCHDDHDDHHGHKHHGHKHHGKHHGCGC